MDDTARVLLLPCANLYSITKGQAATGFLTGAIDERTRFAEGDILGIEFWFSPENLPHNLARVKSRPERKEAAPEQVALAWVHACRSRLRTH